MRPFTCGSTTMGAESKAGSPPAGAGFATAVHITVAGSCAGRFKGTQGRDAKAQPEMGKQASINTDWRRKIRIMITIRIRKFCLESIRGEGNGAGGGIDGVGVVGTVADDNGEFVGFGFEAGEAGGDFVADADGGFELQAAKLGGGVGPGFEWLRNVGRFGEQSLKRQEFQSAGRHRDWFGIARIGGIYLDGDSFTAGKTIQIECDGGGEKVEFVDGGWGSGVRGACVRR